jgi:hypothetical protein
MSEWDGHRGHWIALADALGCIPGEPSTDAVHAVKTKILYTGIDLTPQMFVQAAGANIGEEAKTLTKHPDGRITYPHTHSRFEQIQSIPKTALFAWFDTGGSDLLGYYKGVTEPSPEDEDVKSPATVHFGGDPDPKTMYYNALRNLTFIPSDEDRMAYGHTPSSFKLMWDTDERTVMVKYLEIPAGLNFKMFHTPYGHTDMKVPMLRPGRAPLLF